MSKRNIRKSASTSFQVYRHVNSSSSETSTSSSSSDNSDPPLKRFNRLLRSSVARRWTFFRRQQPSLRSRGRSVSDAGLCTIVDHDLGFLDIPVASARRSLQVIDTTNIIVPTLSITSAGGSSSAALEEASDGSDAERTRRHLRVPTPTYLGQCSCNTLNYIDAFVNSFSSSLSLNSTTKAYIIILNLALISLLCFCWVIITFCTEITSR